MRKDSALVARKEQSLGLRTIVRGTGNQTMTDRASERGDSRRETLEKTGSDDQAEVDGGIIELHLHDMTQLFDPMDPSPFQGKDLNRIAEAHIVDGVEELPSKTACALVLHLDQSRGQADEGRIAGDAIRGHFARQAKLLRRGLRSLIHRGLASLGIGLAFLVVLSIIAQSVDRLLGASAWAALLREGCSSSVGWRCGDRSKYSFTIGGRSLATDAFATA